MTTKEELIQEFRVQEIRAAAGRVVAERGVAGATVEAIAEAAGIAKGTLYLYFQNRDDLLEKVADQTFVELLGELGGILDSDQPFDAQLRGFVGATLRFAEDHCHFFQLYQAAITAAPASRGCHSRRYDEYVERVREWVVRAIDAGAVRRLPADRVALLLADALATLIRHRRSEDPPPVEADTEWLVSMVLHGLAAARAER